MPWFVLKCMLLCALVGGTVCACTLKNHTLWIESNNCAQCVAINTTICSGYCYTQDTNLRGRFGRTFLIQRSCVPHSLVYQAAFVPGCPQDVNPKLYYPVAHRCSCRRCDTRTHHCVRTSRISYDQCPMTLGSLKNLNQSAMEI
ncbi:follitropin subunit beta-like [Seriola aureovittata]|uniref:follitropin subunit beta-like n=1 Tax=Seriola aureovittata TaxID=2871759 RepID=UPI0024BDDE45|nr:follitropin subunit beta-like [Seriola aureovittata]XP_056240260.1 follitropin subunit beta-like [Seriola aureovittata]